MHNHNNINDNDTRVHACARGLLRLSGATNHGLLICVPCR